MTPPEPISFRDGPRDECGVFGVYAPERDVARLAYFALYALQHRGQESAGIATAEDGHIMALRDLGLVSQVFDEPKLQALGSPTTATASRPRAARSTSSAPRCCARSSLANSSRSASAASRYDKW